MKFRRNTKSFMSSRWDTDSEYHKRKDSLFPILMFIIGIIGVIALVKQFLY